MPFQRASTLALKVPTNIPPARADKASIVAFRPAATGSAPGPNLPPLTGYPVRPILSKGRARSRSVPTDRGGPRESGTSVRPPCATSNQGSPPCVCKGRIQAPHLQRPAHCAGGAGVGPPWLRC
jgi:hypothetical protein